MSFDFSRLLRQVAAAVTRAAADELTKPQRRRPAAKPKPTPKSGKKATPKSTRRSATSRRRAATAKPTPRYAPSANGRPDPGEVVWAWVPYEEDPTRGKDRPVLVLDVVGDTVHALQLTSQDHDRDAAQEARAGRYWMDIGSGPWDSRGRPSEVRLNRLLTLDAAEVRREGSALDKAIFDKVVAESRRYL